MKPSIMKGGKKVELTRDSKRLLCLLYKLYLERVDNGISKSSARYMGGSEHIRQCCLPEESLENVDDSCWELLRAGMLDGFGADDMVCESELTDQAIIHMETRFQKGMKELLEFLANFIP